MNTKKTTSLTPKLGVIFSIIASSVVSHGADATWDGGASTNELGTAANWSGDALPNVDGNTATWDGTVAGDLSLTWGGGFGPGFGSTQGIHYNVTSANTGSLTLSGSGQIAFGNLSVASGAGAVTIGNGGGIIVARPSTNNSVWTNNSSNPVTFGTGLLYRSGGGSARTLTFEGAGNWVFNSRLAIETGQSGVLGIVHNGGGTITLNDGGIIGGATASNINSGSLVLSGGSLFVNGALGGAGGFTINSGATLGGTGTISHAVHIPTGATLAPGNSAGNLTLSNGLNLDGAYAWELTALSTAGAGTNFDRVTVSAGDIDLTNALLNLALGAFSPSADPFWGTDQTWANIINNTGSGDLTGTFAAIDNTGWSSLGEFSTTYSSTGVDLVWTAIPEPSGAALLLGSVGMLAFRRRRC